jgi:hypothetical protein
MATKEDRPVDVDAWGAIAAGWVVTVDRMGSADKFYASLPFRQVRYEAATAEDARANLMRDYCLLSRRGSFDPNNPNAEGVPMLQHVLEVLQEELDERLKSRRECTRRDEATDTPGSDPAYDDVASKRSEVIAGLATAIAALARVKAL